MNIKEKIFLLASVITILLLQAQGADKYTDGNRPYEFGFSIDGEQHRHEKKDEKGLIQGEFGFITADGVYHVTVYATDEQGRFKILSMKNIRVKPYPTYTAKQSNTSARQGHSLEPPAELHSAQSPHSVSTTTTTTLKPISIEPPANSCSHCSLPPKPKPAPAVPAFNQPTANVPNQIETALSPKFSQGIKPQSNFFSQPNSNLSPYQGSPVSTQGSPVPGQGAAQNSPIQPQNNLPQFPLPQSLIPSQNPQSIPQQRFGTSQSPSAGYSGVQGNAQGPGSSNPLQLPGTSTFPQQVPQIPANYPAIPQNYPITGITENSPSLSRGNVPSGRTPKRFDGVPPRSVGTPPNGLTQNSLPSNQATPTPTKPTLISAQMQIVDKNTDIHRRGPGENEGLPAGLNKDDMTRLLYTFNYTVGFHGHFEEGYANGVKQGYYFVTGRNGVRTRVDYVADSKGFRPKISQEVLDLLSDDVPKPETEKEEKYGLKGYEFKWLYYPVDSKKR